MNNFQTALATGKVVVRRWWKNANSSKNQVSVQFIQQIERPSDNSSLVAIAQGTPSVQTVTAIFSFAEDVALDHLGSTEGSFVEGGQPIFAEDIFGMDINIQVTENFTKNPFSAGQEPKINPSTGEVVVAFDPETRTDRPVYRHTELVSGTASHTFLAASQNAVNAMMGNVPNKLNLRDIASR